VLTTDWSFTPNDQMTTSKFISATITQVLGISSTSYVETAPNLHIDMLLLTETNFVSMQTMDYTHLIIPAVKAVSCNAEIYHINDMTSVNNLQ